MLWLFFFCVMNHYEVLGVRPTASPQEIELAYRARRTQYHPDKYPQADEATVRWATEQMQRVNEAFNTLSDADARARYDAGLQAEGSRATDARPQRPPKQEAAAASAPASVSLAALLKQRLGGVTFTRVYLAPYIPPKKLTGAGDSFVLGEGNDKVLVLIDATVFGGAKEGIVLTEEGIHFKELGSSAQRRFWEDIREVEVRGTKVLVNGSVIADCTMCEKRELMQVFGVVREFLLARHAATSSPAQTAEMMRRAQQSDTPWTNPVVCQEIFNIARQRVQAAIAPQTLRRTKLDIAADLKKKFFAVKKAGDVALQFKPELAEQELLEIAITDHQRILYKGGLKKLQDAASESNGRKRAQLSFGALHLMKAVCAEPYCLPGTKFLVDKAGREAHLSNSPKLAWLLDHLEEVRKAGEKAIVFTELREAQAALYYFLKESFGLRPFIINGDSQGRQAYIDKFSARDGFDVIILSTLAAGAGLNVTAANHVFHFTRAWNPSKESQATDRAYRIGQERDVFVYCPTVVADDFHTFEVRLDQLLKRKAGLAGATLDDGGLTAMLNGSGKDASFKDLVSDGAATDEALPERCLSMDDVDRMDGNGFEVFCALLWRRQGFQATVTPKRGGDGGIDVVALKGRDGELIQCKSSKSAELGWDAVKEVVAGAAKYQARFRGTRFRKVAVTNQGFTSGAQEQAVANQVELVVRERLADLLKRHPITNYEFDDALQDAANINELVA